MPRLHRFFKVYATNVHRDVRVTIVNPTTAAVPEFSGFCSNFPRHWCSDLFLALRFIFLTCYWTGFSGKAQRTSFESSHHLNFEAITMCPCWPMLLMLHNGRMQIVNRSTCPHCMPVRTGKSRFCKEKNLEIFLEDYRNLRQGLGRDKPSLSLTVCTELILKSEPSQRKIRQ